MPALDAPPIPPKNESGTEITSAHGHDMTRKVSARYIHSEKPAPGINSGGSVAISAASSTITGVYQRANLVINRSGRDFFSLEFSTS